MVKAYGLPTQGAGASFFDFGSVDGSIGVGADGGERRATMGELGKVKDWYRQGMNEGVGNDEEMKGTRSPVRFFIRGTKMLCLNSRFCPRSKPRIRSQRQTL